MKIRLAFAALCLVGQAPLAGCEEAKSPCEGKVCDDKDPCTVDKCNAVTGACEAKDPADGKPCDDGNKCTVSDTCAALKCAGKPKNCDDGDVCTLGEKCDADGACTKGSKKDCDDGKVCTTDTCDPLEGCKNKPNTDTCNDNDACTEGDKCDGGACKGAALKVDDGDPCTTDACTASGGVTHVASTAPCDDKDPCTVNDVCADKKCTPGPKKVCDDSNLCTDDSCDAATGNCKNANNTKDCNDNNACTKDDACDSGTCKGAAVKADDGNPCTDDDCDKKTGVINVANTKACDDGKVCTVGDKCAETKCVAGVAKICDEIDGNACTEPQCLEGAGGCTEVKVKDDAPCTDSDACTVGDKCGNGACLPGAATACNGDGNVCKDWGCDKAIGCTFKSALKGKPCDDKNACTKDDVCDTGACISGASINCQDGEACTDDSCDPAVGCKHAANSQPCDDKNECTTGDACKSGKCAAGAVTACDDKNPCTTDQCDKATGKCGYQAVGDGTPCEDNSLCTNDTVCNVGQCAGGTKVVCKADGNPCTSDECLDATGCKYPAQDGPCDADKSVCTPKDACSAGKCVADTIKSCDDGKVCTTEVCDPLKDCVYTNNTAKCDDGLLCTEGDTCKDGECKVNTPKNCADGNSCTDDKCDQAKGCLNPVALDGSACDDGSACSTGDTCKDGACKSTGESLWLDKKGKALQDRFTDVAVGPDGTIVSVGTQYTDTTTSFSRVVGQASDKSVLFDVKPQKAGSINIITRVTTVQGGGYVAVGQAGLEKPGGWPTMYAMQLNTNGKVDWEAVYDSNGAWGATAAQALGVVARTGGGVVLTGSRYGAFGQGWSGIIGELNSSGALVFTQGYPLPAGFGQGHFYAIAHAPAGGYWLGGRLHYNDAGVAAHILRVQANGAVIFAKVLGKAGAGAIQVSHSLIADKDGVTSFGLSSSGPYGKEDAWVVRLDNNNNVVYERHFGGVENDAFEAAVAAADGGFFVAGSLSVGSAEPAKRAMLGRLSASGLLEWQRTVNQPGSQWRGIALTPAGGIGLAGFTAFQTVGDEDTLVASCDQFGNCDCAASGTCITKPATSVDDKNPCTLDWCEAGAEKHAIGNEGLTCAPSKTCQKGKCL